MREYFCPICSKRCFSDTIECGICKAWVHRKCCGLTSGEFDSWANDDLVFTCKVCAIRDGQYNYLAALQRLEKALATRSRLTVLKQSTSESKLLQTYKVELPELRPKTEYIEDEVDKESIQILNLFHPIMNLTNVPLKTVPDGNCMYRAVSLALFSSEEHHIFLRLLTALEILNNQAKYDFKRKSNQLIDDLAIVHSDFISLVHSCVRVGAYAEMAHVQALSSALGFPIKSYYPPQTNLEVANAYNRTIGGNGKESKCIIMWTSVLAPLNPQDFNVNHFVCLITKKASFAKSEIKPAVVKEKEECVLSDISSDNELITEENNVNSIITDGNGNGRENSEYDDETSCNKRGKLNGAFLDGSTAIHHLLSTGGGLEQIPPGRKENVFFVLDNSRNIARKGNHGHCSFPDDCGVWDSSSGTSPKFYYVMDEQGGLRTVFLRFGKYCLRKTVQRNIEYVPLEPQPDQSQVVVVHRYYTSSKRDPNYKRRVTWLGESGLTSSLAIVEYKGEFPGLSPHGNNINTTRTEYIRLGDNVKEDIINLTDKMKPHQIYNSLKSKYDEVTRPSELRKIHDLQYTARRRNVASTQSQSRNIADQINTIENLVSEGHPFIRTIIRNSGKPPCIILYTDDQLEDIKNFCCTGEAVLGVDKTFMLCRMHVTIMCYKQLSVKRYSTGEAPIFLGPIFIHDHSDFETYCQFFHHIKIKLSGTSLHKLIIGTDDEHAMVKAIDTTLPESTHILCTRHLKQNTKQKLTELPISEKDRKALLQDIFGEHGIIYAEDSTSFDALSSQLDAKWSQVSSSFMEYFRKRLKPPLKNKVNYPSRHYPICRGWTNNNSESINHLLKQTVNWKAKGLTVFIQLVYDLVVGQFRELRSALIASGEFRLATHFLQFQTSKADWMTMSNEQRLHLFKKFRKHKKSQKAMVTSSDGLTTIVEPRTNGRKPGARKRQANVRTSTLKKVRFENTENLLVTETKLK